MMELVKHPPQEVSTIPETSEILNSLTINILREVIGEHWMIQLPIIFDNFDDYINTISRLEEAGLVLNEMEPVVREIKDREGKRSEGCETIFDVGKKLVEIANKAQLFGYSDWEYTHFGWDNDLYSPTMKRRLKNLSEDISLHRVLAITGFTKIDDVQEYIEYFQKYTDEISKRTKEREENVRDVKSYTGEVDADYDEEKEKISFENNQMPRNYIEKLLADEKFSEKDSIEQFSDVLSHLAVRKAYEGSSPGINIYPYHLDDWRRASKGRLSEFIEMSGIEAQSLQDFADQHEDILKAVEVMRKKEIIILYEDHVKKSKENPDFGKVSRHPGHWITTGDGRNIKTSAWTGVEKGEDTEHEILQINNKYDETKDIVNLSLHYLKKWGFV